MDPLTESRAGWLIVSSSGASSDPSGEVEPALAPGTRVGRFEVRGLLGRGGMGVVYRALDPLSGREVAVKLLTPGLARGTRRLARFQREAVLASRLRHPRIVGVLESGEVGGQAYLVMSLAEGRTLDEVLAAEGPFAPRRAAEVVEQLARAVDAAHAERVLHRDLKPGNVMLHPEDGPLILDFGLARDLARQPDLTDTGEVLGTPQFMAPEQVTQRALDHRVDVYGLGAILYSLVTGSPPYDGESAGEVLRRILAGPPPTPRDRRPDVPLALETICLRAMAREPALRYASAGDLADDLARWLDGAPVRASGNAVGYRMRKFVARNRLAVTL
ncbi:MAG: serine/threonine protein kinase, partial [Planctomycetota bacterium]|nr:serine/threonine protein kinase [Planctomycetota bacterium]